jgi:hypothetical protein
LEELNRLAKESKDTRNLQALESIFQKSHVFSKYGNEAAFRGPLSVIEERLRNERDSTKSLTDAPRVLDGQPAPRKKSMKMRAMGFLSLRPEIAWGAISFLLVVLVLSVVLILGFAIRSRIRSGGEELRKHVASDVVTLSVSNVPTGAFRVLDSHGADVTAKSLRGLTAGQYRLLAAKPGFKNAELPFNIEPSKETQKTLEVQWQPMVTTLNLKLKKPLGVLTIDGIEQSLDSSAEVDAKWPNARHSVSWQLSSNDSVRVEIEVNDTGINIGAPEVRGSVFGLVVVLNSTEVQYQAINISGGLIKDMDGQAEPLPSLSGVFAAHGTRLVGFRVKHGGYPLGDLPTVPNGERSVYVYFAPLDARAGISKRARPTKPPNIDPPQQVVVPTPPALTEEELKQKERREKANRDFKERQERQERLLKAKGTEKP